MVQTVYDCLVIFDWRTSAFCRKKESGFIPPIDDIVPTSKTIAPIDDTVPDSKTRAPIDDSAPEGILILK